MPSASVSIVSEAGSLQSVSSFLVCLAGIFFRSSKNVMASVQAGSRVCSNISRFWGTPCAGSCKEYVNAVLSESLIGRTRTFCGLCVGNCGSFRKGI